MKSFFLLLFFTCPFVLFSQFYSGAENSGRAGAFVFNNGVWSTSGNQAGLGLVNSIESGVFYTNKYLNQELHGVSIVTTLPFSSGTFGFEVQQLMFSSFSDRSYTIAYGMKLSKNISAGVGLLYRQISFGNYYGSGGNIIVEGGVTWLASEQFACAVHVSNPFFSHVKYIYNEIIPVILSLGTSYKPISGLSIVLQIDKDFTSGFNTHISLEKIIYKDIIITVGYQTTPNLYAFGLGLNKKKWRGNMSFSVDPILGWYPELSVVYIWNKGS